MYAYLEEGDYIRSSDECLMGDKWQAVPSALVGEMITSANVVFRRRVAHTQTALLDNAQ